MIKNNKGSDKNFLNTFKLFYWQMTYTDNHKMLCIGAIIGHYWPPLLFPLWTPLTLIL